MICAGAGYPAEVRHPEVDVTRQGICPGCGGVVYVEADGITLPHEPWQAEPAT